MRAFAPRPICSSILGSWVVLPDPVSPQTITTGCASIAARISSRLALIGSAVSKAIDGRVAAKRGRGYRSRLQSGRAVLLAHCIPGRAGRAGGDPWTLRDRMGVKHCRPRIPPHESPHEIIGIARAMRLRVAPLEPW